MAPTVKSPDAPSNRRRRGTGRDCIAEPANTLVLGGQPRVVVAVARSLHRRGISVVAASMHAWDAAVRSRAIRAIELLPDYSTDPAGCGRELLRVVQRHKVDCLMIGNDQALNVVCAHYAALSRLVHVTCPPPEIVNRVLDKAEALQVARDAGVPVPRTFAPTSAASLESLRPALRFPLVVKVSTRARQPPAAMPAALDTVEHVPDFPALQAVMARLSPAGAPCLLQEYHEGEDVHLALLVHRGEALVRFQCRAVKTMPRRGGPSVMTVTEAVDEAMLAQAMNVLRRLKWEGVAQLDFRRDRRTGQWVFLEINGRFWGSVPAAIRAGQDFPWQAWLQAHGLPVSPNSRYRVGQAVRWFAGDLRRLAEVFRRGAANWPERRRELGRFLIDSRPTVAGMLWSWRDPLPAFDELRIALRNWALTRLRMWRKRRM